MTMSMFEAILEAIRCYWHQPKPSITTTTVPPTPTLNLHSSLDPGLLHQVSSQFDPIIFISLFATGCAIILTTTYFVLARCRRLSRADFWAVVWFINGGSIHLLLSGYYAFFSVPILKRQGSLAQLWKPCSLSDSHNLRPSYYLNLCIEIPMAVFWDFLSFVVAWMIITGRPLRHPLQIVVGLGQVYAGATTCSTRIKVFEVLVFDMGYEFLEGRVFYFWLVDVWIMVPSWLMYTSMRACERTFTALAKMEKTLKRSRCVR